MALLCATGTLALGAFGLGDALTGQRLFGGSVLPQYIPMAVSTAALFLFFSGVLAWAVVGQGPGSRPVLLLTIGIATLLGASECAQYLFGLPDLALERPYERFLTQLFGRSTPMSPVTSALFLLTGCAVGLLHFRRRQARAAWRNDVAAYLGVAVSFVSLTLLGGYLHGAPFFYGTRVVPVAVTTSMSFLLLGTGLVYAAGPGSLFMGAFFGDSAKARLMRVFPPFVAGMFLFHPAVEILVSKIFNVNADLLFSLQVTVLTALTAAITALAVRVIGVSMDRETVLRRQAESTAVRESRINKAQAEIAEALIRPGMTIQGIADILHRIAMQLTGSNFAFVTTIDPVTGDNIGHTLSAMVEHGECGMDRSNIFKRNPDGSYPALWGHALNTLEAFFENAPASHPLSRGLPAGHVPLEQFLSAPVRYEQQLVGQIGLANPGRDFTQEDLDMVLPLADLFALGVHRIRSEQEMLAAKEGLERTVRQRTQALEDANVQLRSEVQERGLYQQALTESAGLYRAVVEDQGELICRFRPDGAILFANKAHTRIFGGSLLSPAEDHSLLLHGGAERSLEELLALITKDSNVLSFEQQATAPSGQKAWFNWTCRGIFDGLGELGAYQLVGQDVTRIRQAEQALRDLNENLEEKVRERTIQLEERTKSILQVNADLQLEVENRKIAELAKLQAVFEQQVKVRQISALFGLAEVLSARWDSLEDMLLQGANSILVGWRGQAATAGEIVFDGQTYRSQNYQEGCGCLARPLMVSGQDRGHVQICHPGPCGQSPAAFAPDEEALLASMAHQLERAIEAHLSHERLVQSEREFREFFDNAAEAIFIHDETGRILDANKLAGIWLNLAAESMVGLNLLDLSAEEDRENLAGRFLNALREVPEIFRVTLRRKDGFTIPLELLCQTQDYQGRKVLVSSGRNIIKRQQAEAEARRRMDQELLLSGISSRLVNAIGVEVPSAMSATLAEICGFIGMQRAMVYHFEESKQRFGLAHQWGAEGLPALPGTLKTLGRVKTPWLFERSMTQEWLTIRDVGHLPPAAHKEKRLLAEAGITCLTAIPMSIRGRLQGLFLVASLEPRALFAPDPQLLLQFAPMFSNILLRQYTREALRASANLIASILNSLSTYLCVLDRHGVITLVNRAWQQSGAKSGPGLAGSLTVGGNYLDYCRKAAEDGDEHAAAIQEGIRSVISGQSSVFRLEFSSRSGPALHWYLLEATPSGKGAHGAVVSHLNITSRKRAEQRLSRNEARYRTLVETLHEGLLMIRRGGIISFANDQFARMLGWPKATLLGRKPEEYVAAESLAGLTGLLAAEKDTQHAEEIIWNHASGRHVYTLVSPSKTRDEDGKVAGTFAVITDTTERKGLESQLLQSQKLEAIGQLAAGIAHEINTPAQYVGNNVQFIKSAFEDILAVCGKTREFMQAAQKTPPTREDVEALAAVMAERDIDYLEAEVPGAIAQTLEGVERISTIVRSVKQFAHPGAATMSTADLNEAMLSTVTVSRNEWKYVADLTTDLDKDLPLVICMIGEINQVVLNLIINAAHAIADAIKDDPEGRGRITLTTRLAPPWAEIRVTDTGTGIPPSVQAKIFDPFFTTKEVGRGTGQGLTISRSIVVEKHKGQLFFETEPGVGTTFVVRLPLLHAEEPEQ